MTAELNVDMWVRILLELIAAPLDQRIRMGI